MNYKQHDPKNVVNTYYRMMARVLNMDVGEKNMEKFLRMQRVYDDTVLSITDSQLQKQLIENGREIYSREVKVLVH